MEYLYANPNSTDPFWQSNLRWYVCRDCAYQPDCKQGDEMPVISPLSRYILRWNAEQKVVPGYPCTGTWEDQPVWFGMLMTACASKYNRLEMEKMNSGK